MKKNFPHVGKGPEVGWTQERIYLKLLFCKLNERESIDFLTTSQSISCFQVHGKKRSRVLKRIVAVLNVQIVQM